MKIEIINKTVTLICEKCNIEVLRMPEQMVASILINAAERLYNHTYKDDLSPKYDCKMCK